MHSSGAGDEIASADRIIKRSHKHAAYGTLTAGFALGLGALVLTSRRKLQEAGNGQSTARSPADEPMAGQDASPKQAPVGGFSWQDLVLCGIAAHKITAMVAQDRVTQPLRAPFTEEEDGKRVPKGGAFRHSLGELVTCKYCLSPWVALGLGAAYIRQPAAIRFGTGVFTVVAISDFLNRSYAKLSD